MKIPTLALITTATVAAPIAVAACSTSTNGTGKSTTSGGLMRRRIAALGLLAVVAIAVAGCSQPQQSPQPTAPASESNGPTTPASGPTLAPVSRQTVLPFTGLESPHDVAVDTAGNVYVIDIHSFKDHEGFSEATNHVIELAAGSNTQTVLPFTRSALAVDPGGAVWVIGGEHGQLVKLAPGGNTQTVLPLPDLGVRGAVMAVDTAGNAYGTNGGGVYPDGGCCIPVHVVKSAVGSNAPTVLPFTDLFGPSDMAVDTAGDVYITDDNRVLKLAAGSNAATVLPFTDLGGVVAVAVDSAGSVYVVDAGHSRVLKLAAGSDAPTVLPFTGLVHPVSVAVDTAGNVYVVDVGNHTVFKLAAA